MTVGQKLIALRGDKSRRKVAEGSGVPARTLIHWERDERFPTLDKLIKLLSYYGADLNSIMPDGKDLDDIIGG